jgi:hypothetical protein
MDVMTLFSKLVISSFFNIAEEEDYGIWAGFLRRPSLWYVLRLGFENLALKQTTQKARKATLDGSWPL